ncbi:MAG: gliding motility-associated C-terminal domain-containing protein [Flavobacteriales bacterium]
MLAAILFVLLQLAGRAQPVCSIDIGNDTTICAGESVVLTGPAGYTNHLWSTGETTPSITVNAAGNYSCQVSYPTGNLTTNGNFSSGNMGFNTMFNYGTPLTNEGNYWIGTNAALYHPQFAGTGNGAFLMVNAGWMHAGWRFWCQTIDVCPGQTYTISFRAASLSISNPPVLAWFVNNVWTGVDHTPPVAQGQWQNFSVNWTAPAGTTTAEFCIQVSSGWGIGNDFGFDDVDIRSTVVLTDQVTVNVTPLPVVDLGPDVTLCDGQSITLDVATPGGTYLWQDGSTTSSAQVTVAGTYGVTVTANGCSASDAIDVSYNPLPVVDLGPDIDLCTGETVVLDVTQPGASYGWSDGSNGPSLTVSAAGTYGVTVFQNNCFASDAVDVFYNPYPVVDIGADATLCLGDQITYDATTPGATYLWHDGSTGPTFSAGSTGTVSVDVTVNGCTTTDDANVVVNTYPFFDLGPNVTVCPGTVVTLDATVPGATYLWQDGSTAATFNAAAPGNYSVQVTLNGCTSGDAVNLSHFALPVVDLGADQSICAGTSTTLGVNVPGATYLWSTGATTDNITVSTAGTYSVDVTLNGCTVSDAVTIAEIPLPAFDLGPDQFLCPGVTNTLDASVQGGSYLWSNGATTPTIDAGPGTYSVTVTANNCSAVDAITLGQHPAATVDLGADTTLCPGQSILLSAAQAGASYLWQDGSTAATLLVSSPGTYGITLTDGNGCTAQDAIDVDHANPQPIDLGPDAVICAGTSLVLDATAPGASHVWSTGATSPTITVNSAGIYSVTVTEGTCSTTDAITVQVSPLPIVELGNDTTLCPGQTLVLTGPVGASLLWSTGATGNSIVVSTAGTYTLTATNADGCQAVDAITVNYATPGAIDLGTDQNICQGTSITLDATLTGATHLWSTGATTPTISVSAAGTYSVEVIQGGCSVTDAITIGVDPVPVFDLGPDLVICQGQSATLDATVPGATYLWSTGATAPTITVGTTGLYTVTADLNGCTATDQVQVTVLSPTSIDLGPDQVLCQGESLTLDATVPGATYLWSTGATTPTITVTTSDTYSVEIFQGACSVSDAVNITVNPAPVFDLGADRTICAGSTTILDATVPGASYLWSTGATTPTITTGTAGTFSVTVTLNSCAVTDAVDVEVSVPQSVDLGPDVVLCQGESITFDASVTGATYLWSTGATTPTITVTSANTYSVQVFQGICSVSDIVQVAVNPAPTLELGADQVICEGASTILNATYPGATYAWSNGATTPTITVNTSGTYAVTIDLNGCAVQDEVTITVLSPDAVDLGPDVQLCLGEAITLDAGIAGGAYTWSTGATSATLTTGTAGTYWVNVAQGLCAVSDTIVIAVVDPGVLDLGDDATLCDGETLVLDGTLTGATYLWEDGTTGATRTITGPGTYSLIANVQGCEVEDAITVAFNPIPDVDLGPNVSLCPGEEVVLQAPTPGASYLWNSGSTADAIVVNSTGTYTLTVTLNNCSNSDAVNVTVVQGPVLELGPDTTLCEGQQLSFNLAQPGGSFLWNDGITTAQRSITTDGSYSVTVTRNGCTKSDTITVQFFDPAVVDLGPDQRLCPGESISLAADVDADLLWSTGSMESSITVGSAGTYWLEASNSGCVVRDSVRVTYVPLVAPVLPRSSLGCAGDTITLSVNTNGAAALWSDGSTADSLRVSNSGIYSVSLTLEGCVASTDAQVVLLPLVIELPVWTDSTFCPGEELRLNAEVPFASYVWSTGHNGPALVVPEVGNYQVTVTTPCASTDRSIFISDGECAPLVNIPNAFTPDGDGINDVFFVSLSAVPLDLRLSIFNRWGEPIFESSDPFAQWDGTYQGRPAPQGVYTYQFTYRKLADTGVVAERLMGHVTLIR